MAGLSFTPVNEDHVNNNYPVSIDPYVDQATIISFYTQGVQDNPLIRNGQAIPQGSIEKTPIDKHYEIDTILNPASNAGTYTVSTVGNAPVSVYALIASNFTLQLVSPTTATIVQPGHKLTIQAHFLNNGTPVVTGSNAPLHTRVIFTLNGQPSQSFDILLYPKSGSDIYEGTYLVPQSSQKPGKTVVEIGTLSISTSGTASFQGTAATRGTGSTIIAIDEPKAQPLPPIPPKPCQAGALQCFLIQNHTFVSIAIPLVLLFILLLFLLLQLRSPFTGKIINIDLAQLDRQGNYQPMRKFDSENIATIYLGTKRSFMDRMLHRNTISSTELQKHKDSRGLFSFDGQQFQLIAPQKGRVVIKPAPGARIEVKRAEVQTEVPKPPVSKSISYDPEGRTNTTNNATLKEATTPISTQLPLMSGDIVRIDNHDNFMFL